MHPDRDWAEEPALTERFRSFRRAPLPPLPVHEQALIQDLALDVVLTAMAGGDDFVFEVAQRALLTGVANGPETILYRQQILADCLSHLDVIRELYAIAVEAISGKRKYYIADYHRYPSSILYSAVEAMEWYAGMLRKVRALADANADRFASKRLTSLLAMLQDEFSDEYFDRIESHLRILRFRDGTLLSASLGAGNQGIAYTLHRPRKDDRSWFERLVAKAPAGYTFYIHERDEAGARAVGELRDRGINAVANALAQSTDHVVSFFTILRAELAFYVGCLNLADRLRPLGVPTSLPEPAAAATRRQRFTGLCDVALALQTNASVVGNAVDADGRNLVIITGANQGGKSTFLRSIGLAQLMMQSGMFVGAERFTAEVNTAVFTHYKREEDTAMKHGKLDEELARMSKIVGAIRPNALLLFNESFASTNEREGSEIARQLVTAMLDKHIKVFFVTHLYEFAGGMFGAGLPDALFLRAERESDGTRSFRLVVAAPQETSYGADLFDEVFADQREASPAG